MPSVVTLIILVGCSAALAWDSWRRRHTLARDLRDHKVRRLGVLLSLFIRVAVVPTVVAIAWLGPLASLQMLIILVICHQVAVTPVLLLRLTGGPDKPLTQPQAPQEFQALSNVSTPVPPELIRLVRAFEGESGDPHRNDREAISACDDAIARYGSSTSPAVLDYLGFILLCKGRALESLGRAQESLATYRDIVKRFASIGEVGVEGRVAGAYARESEVLAREGQLEGAAAVAGEAVVWLKGRATVSVAGPTLVDLAFALYARSRLLLRLHRAEEATESLEELVAAVEKSGISGTSGCDPGEFATGALLLQGDALYDLGRAQDAISAYQRAIDRIVKAKNPRPIELADALIGMSYAERDLRLPEDSVRSADQALVSLRGSTGLDADDRVARALVSRGLGLTMKGDSMRAVTSYEEVIARFGSSNETRLRKAVVIALVEKASLLVGTARATEALAACDEVERRLAGTSDPALLLHVEQARRIRDSVRPRESGA